MTTGRLCSIQAFAHFRVIQPTGEFGFASKNYVSGALRRLMAFLRAFRLALRYRLRVLWFEYLRLSAFCSHRWMSLMACRYMGSWPDRRGNVSMTSIQNSARSRSSSCVGALAVTVRTRSICASAVAMARRARPRSVWCASEMSMSYSSGYGSRYLRTRSWGGGWFNPWRTPFWEDLRLPVCVFGPVLWAALRRLEVGVYLGAIS